MAYYMYMGDMQIPIPPETLETTINNKNETINLLGVGEVNVLKLAGLTDITFKMLLPNSSYPFNESMLMKSKMASYYVDKLEQLKNGNALDSLLGNGKPKFQFIVVRMKPNGSMLQMTNMKVTLEDYKVIEEAENGFDAYADIKLKQWRDYGTKKITLQTDKDGNVTGTAEKARDTGGKVAAATARAAKGTTLQRMIKQQFGNTNNLFKIAALNKIAIPATLAIGQVVKMRERGDLGGLF
ncbi:peptidoglycan-binding protein [Megasphaera vaginalis (ex Bordigoni et al. 2020)]|uniref:peptidoglycan-binding protein n=1 Tax=Megasphaera vaginalis (ex Bordigoni et al. 2020) TaxID=2045301 RepID=UPI000C7D1E2A|nr:peptidoglycan-binding protein [Megasphaera vaginalis (ex Bordigoni et al. 2020)]